MNIRQTVYAVLCIIAIAILSVNTLIPTGIKEGFWGDVQFTTRAVPVEYNPKTGQTRASDSNLLNVNLGHDFISTPNFQSVLAPRFDNNAYGANIRYNLPDNKHMAAPLNPLTFANALSTGAKEAYVPKCSGFGSPNGVPSSDPTNGVNPPDTTYSGGESQGNALPIGSMTSLSASGVPEQVQVYERYMVANPKNRLFGRGDYIRGDIPIVPDKTGWFQVATTPSTSLNAGALAVMGGIDNKTSQQLYSLINADSGGARTTFGGVNLSNVQMQNSLNLGLSNSIKDINVSAFP